MGTLLAVETGRTARARLLLHFRGVVVHASHSFAELHFELHTLESSDQIGTL